MNTVRFIVALFLITASVAVLSWAQQTTQPVSLAERFKQLDRNGDGKLTRDEVPRLFDQFDANKDGVVTQEEARAFRPGAPVSPASQTSMPTPSADTLKRTPDIRYANTPGVEAKSQSLDVYAPKDAKNAPVIIFIHGGGWRNGDKSNPGVGAQPAAHFCAEGFVFVSINYRLTPAGEHPANIQDVAKAVAWVHDHIAEHGGDPAQINIMGHSAGAHLTALVATDETRLKAEGKPLSILKRAILLDTAAYDIPRYLKEFQEAKGTSPMRQLYTNAFGDTEEQWRDASPQAHVAPEKHIPPMLMFFTGSRMAANTLAPAFAEALTKAGAPARAVDTITLTHGEIGMKAADKDHPLGQLVRRFLKGEDATKFPDKLGAAAPAPATPAPQPVMQPPAPQAEAQAKVEWVTREVKAPCVSFHTFDNAAAKGKVSYHLYTPAAYDRVENKDRRFPVVCWLHGSGGGAAGLAKAAAHFDAAIEAGKTPPFLVVFVNGLVEGMYVDWNDGSVPMETVIVKYLVPHIDGAYRTIAMRGGRMLDGFSMDGYGAARLGFKHTDLFRAVSIVGAGPLQAELIQAPRAGRKRGAEVLQEVYGGDQEYFRSVSPRRIAEQNSAAITKGSLVRIVVGDRDETFAPNREFHEHLERLKIPHTWTVLPGVAHDPMGVLTAMGDDNWAFYRAAFGEQPSVKPAAAKPDAQSAPGRTPLATRELDIRDYFSKSWSPTAEMGASRFAYNEFTPFMHPDTGARVHLIGGWIHHPAGGELSRSAWMLVRDAAGHYTHLRVWNAAHPPAENIFGGLRGCRTICVSRFPEDQGRVIYCGGFDANGLGTETKYRDTAWIYRGTLPPAAKEKP